MDIFNLPDLGEGLADAEIHHWFVKVGDSVVIDQPMVSMETAKSLVDIPCPKSGVVMKVFGDVGQTINTGAPLIAFEQEQSLAIDLGTVVGNLEQSDRIQDDPFIIGALSNTSRPKATPAIRMLAKKLHIDLNHVKGSGEHGLITRQDVEQAANKILELPEGFEPLRGVRRSMATTMTNAYQAVVPASLFDVVDINAWPRGSDITIRLIQAIQYACTQEPSLNVWYDDKRNAIKRFDELNLGIAMDSEEGLFVPVIHRVGNHSPHSLRLMINNYKIAVSERSLTAEQSKEATFILSNFGKFSGRFGTPIVVPPMVAILGVGKLFSEVVNHHGVIESHRMLPLSLSIDHRAVTGGEATRFLQSLIDRLHQPD